MKKAKLASLLSLIALVAILGTSMAYATSTPATPSPSSSGVDLQVVLTDAIAGAGANAGVGAGAGIFMSILRVIGKNLNAITSTPTTGIKGEAFDIAQLVITAAIGGAIGYVLSFAGITGTTGFSVDFLTLFVVNNLLRPIFRNWQLRVK
jgi:hypothetical protein